MVRPLQVHFKFICPAKTSPKVWEILVSPMVAPSPQLVAQLISPGGSQSLLTFIDFGADACNIDEGLVDQLGLEQVPLHHPFPSRALEGHVLGTVTRPGFPCYFLATIKRKILPIIPAT